MNSNDVDVLFIIFSLPAGLYARDITLYGLNPFLPFPTPNLHTSLSRLEELSIVHVQIEGRYDDKIYRISPSELESLQPQFSTMNQDPIWRSLLAFYLDMLKNNEDTRNPQSRELVIPEIRNAHAVILHALSHLSIVDDVNSLLAAFFTLTNWAIYCGHPSTEPFDIVLPLLEGSPKKQAECYWLLGRTHRFWYDFDAVKVAQDRALELSRSVGDLEGEARVLTSIGDTHSTRDEMAEAESLYRQVLVLSQSSGDVVRHARMLKRIGKLHRRKDEFEEGIACFEEAASLLRRVHDRSGEGTALTQLGALHMQQERYDEAENILREALALHKMANAPTKQGHDFLRLSQAYERRGQSEDAKSYAIQSQQIFRQQRDITMEAEALAALADLERRESSDLALAIYAECVEMQKSAHNLADQARMLGAISNIRKGRKELDLARTAITESVALQEGIANYYGQAEAYYQLGSVEVAQHGPTETAESIFNKALELHRRIDDRNGELYDLRYLVSVFYRRAEWARAKECLLQGVKLHRFISVINRSYEFRYLGRVSLRQGLVDEAELWFNQSLECYKGAGPTALQFYGADTKRGEVWDYLSKVALNQHKDYKAAWMLKASRKYYEHAQDANGVQQAQDKLRRIHHLH